MNPDCSTVTVFFELPGRPPSCDPLIHRLASLAWEDYAAATRDLLAGPFGLERLHARIDEYSALIAQTVDEDKNGPSPEVWRVAVADLKADLATMRSFIESKVAE